MEKGESRKKGIAITAVVAIAALKPTNYMELSVVVGIVLIALYAINRQANIDKGEKNGLSKNNTTADTNKQNP